MLILMTNDDGFEAEGLQVLYRTLAECSEHQIYIVAPDRQRSATGRGITLFQPLFVEEKPLLGEDKGYAVSGTPVDCVKLALQGDLLPRKPDVLLSGMNHGPNLGTDVLYSGTVGAALEGVLLGVPSLAVSVLRYQETDFCHEALYVRDFLAEHEGFWANFQGALNVNFPGGPAWLGTKVAQLGKAVYQNYFEFRKAPFGKDYCWIAGELDTGGEREDSDTKAVQAGYVSFTPLHNDLTDKLAMAALTQEIRPGKESES